MGILSSFFDVVAGVSILAGRSSLLDTSLTTIAGRNLTVRGALGLSFLSIGFINLVATSRKQKKIERLTKDAETFGAENGLTINKNDIEKLYITGGRYGGECFLVLEDGKTIKISDRDLLTLLKMSNRKSFGIEKMRKYHKVVGKEFMGAETFGAEREIHQLITFGGNGEASTLVFQNPDDIKDYLYYGLYGFENLMDEKWYIDDDSAEELNKKNFDKKTKNMSIDEVIRYLHFSEVYYMKTLVDLDKDFLVDGRDGGIVQASFKGDRTGFGAETFSAHFRIPKSDLRLIPNPDGSGGFIVDIDIDSMMEIEKERKERQRIQRNKRAKERREMKKYLRSQGLTEEEIKNYMKDLARERRYRVAETFNAPAAVMRTYKGRKSPSISAKSVKVGTRKRGNDGKMWQVRSVKSRGKRTQRWFKD